MKTTLKIISTCIGAMIKALYKAAAHFHTNCMFGFLLYLMKFLCEVYLYHKRKI